MIRTKTVVIPGRQVDLTLPLAPMQTPIPEPTPAPCIPDPQGVFWYSDVSGQFDAIAEAAYLLPRPDPDAPLDSVAAALGVARVMGNLCGEAVIWQTDWTPATPAANSGPVIAKLDDTLAVSAVAQTTPGILTVYAKVAGQTLGPITLTLAWLPCTPDVRGLCIITPPGPS